MTEINEQYLASKKLEWMDEFPELTENEAEVLAEQEIMSKEGINPFSGESEPDGTYTEPYPDEVYTAPTPSAPRGVVSK